MKIKIIFVVENTHFSMGALKHFLKKGTEFKKRLQFAPKSVIPLVYCFFSGDIAHLNQWYFIGYVARASRRGRSSECFAIGNGELVTGWKRLKESLRTTWTRIVENDLAPLNIGLHSDLRKAQNRTGWCRLAATATIWHGVCQGWWNLW